MGGTRIPDTGESDRAGTDDARRRFLQGAGAGAILLAALAGSRAWAGGRPEPLVRWARELAVLNGRVVRGELAVTDWQARIEQLNTSVAVEDLVAWLDIDRLERGFRYPTRLADVADPVLPADLVSPGARRAWFVRVFGMRRGGTIIPHVHNHMVSAHLVVSGAFHARTHDRLRDLDDAVVLKPSIDGRLARGAIISMSDRRDNQHWLVALEDRSLTFDVGVVDVAASWPYRLAANSNHMIFVDAGAKPQADGLVVAPVMSFGACAAKYAGA
ncbi:hypothetical protein [Dokdonella fugitiva]|jgi:hypothetical protein|uniref:Uncharacterized protein n=1 Tax=Dokdonella fugitiva TaxID=328517 RepID=A0A4V2S357_9GAMM|nr:hypothetical protein [Dokdonella fugitiva]TCO43100.1 hypothetical protein EV148_101519 [Dokdonella fugitiva]